LLLYAPTETFAAKILLFLTLHHSFWSSPDPYASNAHNKQMCKNTTFSLLTVNKQQQTFFTMQNHTTTILTEPIFVNRGFQLEGSSG